MHFKLELPSDAALAIFGYNGSTITTIRERTGCRIRLLPAPAPVAVGVDVNRVLEMGGGQDGAINAVGLILAEMQKCCNTNPKVCTPAVDGPQYVIRFLVRSDACGCIIGKGGSTISQMRSTSGAQIKVDTAEGSSYDQQQAAVAAGLNVPPDRTIIVTGLVTSVHSAILDIIPRVAQYIKQFRAKAAGGTVTPAAPGAAAGPVPPGQHPLEQGPGYVHHVSSGMVGKLIGPGGCNIREIRDKSGARVRVGNDKVGDERPVTIWGTETQVQIVLTMINEILARPDDRPPRQPRGAAPAAPSYNPYAPPPAYAAAPPGYPPSYQQPGYYSAPPGYPQQPAGAPPAYGAPPPPPSSGYQDAAAPAPAPAPAYAPPAQGYEGYTQPPAYGAPPPPPAGGYAPPPGGAPPPPPQQYDYSQYYAQQAPPPQ